MLGSVALRVSLKRRATEEPSTASSSRVGKAMTVNERGLEKLLVSGMETGGDQLVIRP
jgi:hypothetical protein